MGGLNSLGFGNSGIGNFGIGNSVGTFDFTGFPASGITFGNFVSDVFNILGQ